MLLAVQDERADAPRRSACAPPSTSSILANTAPTKLLTVIPYSFYPETEWRDDLELGATELYFALASGGLPSGLARTDPAYYLGKAAHWANAYMTGPNDAGDTLNLYDVSGLAHYELLSGARASRAACRVSRRPQRVAGRPQEGAGRSGRAGGDRSVRVRLPWDTWDTTSHGAGLSVMAAEYDTLVGAGTYANEEMNWLSNILGANGWGSSFIVGDGSTFPHCMQHQVTNIVGCVRWFPADPRGGRRGGAERDDLQRIADGYASVSHLTARIRSHRSTGRRHGTATTSSPSRRSSLAIDLTASSPLAFAWQIHGTPPPGVRRGRSRHRRHDPVRRRQRGPAERARLLSARNMAATFYINSGFIGDATHLSTTDLHTLFNAGTDRRSHDRSREHQEAEDGGRAARGAWDRVTLMDASLGVRVPGHVVRVPVRLIRRWLRAGRAMIAATTAVAACPASTTRRPSPRRSHRSIRTASG